jgi:hypothetical protein
MYEHCYAPLTCRVEPTVVLAEPVADAAGAVGVVERAVVRKAPDIVDQAQQVSPAVAAGCGYGVVHGSTSDTSEYRDGSPDQHFQVKDVSLASIADALSQWMRGDRTFIDDHGWKPLSI